MEISVITTTFNRINFLQECIASFFASVLVPLEEEFKLEYIIYDDASTDGTELLFQENKFPGVKYIREEINKGPSYGRNRAIGEAQGDYIFVIDSDDVMLQRTIYNFARNIKKYPDTDWFISDFLRVDADLKYMKENDYYGWEFDSPGSMLSSIFKNEHFIQHNVCFKRKLFLKAGGYNEQMRMAEDLDLYVRFLLNNSMPKYCGFISHLHRMHDGNLSAAIDLEANKKYTKLIQDRYRQ